MHSVFDFNDYKTLLFEVVKNANRRGFASEMAQAAGCSQSYLSQVIHGKPDVTPDQALALAQFFHYDTSATEYFLNLVHMGRAVTPKLKTYHAKILKNLLAEDRKTFKAVKGSAPTVMAYKHRDYYYSKAVISSVHILTACADFQTATQIADRLRLPINEVEAILGKLLDIGLVKKHNGRFQHTNRHVHLPTESVHNNLNHLNWRLQGLQSTHDETAIHYTSAFAINRSDWDKLKVDLIQFIESQRHKIIASGSEDVYVFCCDLFQA